MTRQSNNHLLIRAMGETLDQKTPGSQISPDLSRHAYFGKIQSAHNQAMSWDL